MSQLAIDGNFIYFVTANVQNRWWFFVTAERADRLGHAIVTSCRIKQFGLLAYCILPNHIHLLVRKLEAGEGPGNSSEAQRTLGSMRCEDGNQTEGPAFLFKDRRLPSRRSIEQRPTLSDLMHSIKSTFSQYLHQGKFWQHRSNFRIIDGEEYFGNVVEYIRYNYTKMDLPDRYGQAPFVFIDELRIRKVFEG